VGPEGLVLEAEAVEDALGLPVAPRGDLDVVAAIAQQLDHRPQNERVRSRRAIDPDAQGSLLARRMPAFSSAHGRRG
jgi:hypothetical protein